MHAQYLMEMGSETAIYTEAVQMKWAHIIPVFRCLIIISHYCGHWFSMGISRYIRFRKHKTMEASESHTVKAERRVALAVKTVLSNTGAITSYSVYLSGNMDGNNNCKVRIMKFPDGNTLGWRTAQAIYKITLKQEFAKMNKLSGTMFSSRLKTEALDKSMVDCLKVPSYGSMECWLVLRWRGSYMNS
jgi:hypothetical protein